MKRLFDLDPAEVSLVPRGANRKKFLVFKHLKGSQMAKSDNDIRALVAAVTPEKMAKIDKVLKGLSAKKVAKDGDLAPKSDSRVSKEPGEMEPGHQPLSDRAQAALKAIARIMVPFKDELTGEHLGAVAQEVGIGDSKTEPSDEATPGDETHKGISGAAFPQEVSDEHKSEAVAMAKKAYGAHLEKLGYRKYPDAEMQQKSKEEACEKDADSDEDEEEEDRVGKVNKAADLDLSAFSKEQRGQLDVIFKSHQDLVQKNADLEKELAHERDLRETKEFTERAQGFKHLGANTEKLATVLKSLAKSDKKAFDEVDQILKSADKKIGTGDLFKEIGSSRSGGDPGSAAAKLDALVDSVVQKGDERTREQVYDAVIRTGEGKKLYNDFRNERKGGC